MPRTKNTKKPAKKLNLGIDANQIKARTLDELLGENVSNPFKTTDIEEFEKNLADMNLQEMETLATRVDLIPINDRRIMKDRLMKQFKSYALKYRPVTYHKNQELSAASREKVKRLLSEGR